ncbi:MAG: SDR family oxidoreductase [Gammaproteobacteria bacterium]|nr:SDR family oxidoreductase [Gammaproteobacteria bacterium]NIM74865.1 SDR family oxidoreductase [Gammaproteobacteria bacterium]NIN39457.1 SDR family oxidoreductase [Gammaproteobacteria bacterium]NIO26783.1 SDR family oxidoreductase [Gammaproteobacteria bacterium]NIO67339.1 SDR family oxidoreductase [Gammaproteobacteria bacterium]
MSDVMIVTGASRGIGAATARIAGERGYAVCVNYRQDADAAAAVVADIEKAGSRAIAVAGDMSSEKDVLNLFETTDAELGTLKVLVNNAGIVDVQSRVEDLTLERLQRMFAINITGAFLCAREAVRRMSTGRGGSGGAIVNVSSAAARLGGPGEYVDYAASKGAMDTMTIGLAKEVAADGIRVNAVRPGLIYTDIHASGGEPGRVDRLKDGVPMKRGGSAEEVARVILWLASDEASYTTGSLVECSGGR